MDYLEKRNTISGDYYASKLTQLKAAIKPKHRGKLGAGMLLIQDNAPVQTAQTAVAAAANCGFELLQHPAFSSDLAPSDFYLLPKVKSHLPGRQFRNNDDVIHAAEEYLWGGGERGETKDSNIFPEGIAMLEHRWTKCTDVKGDYIEKW